jgi:hypothetical protein
MQETARQRLVELRGENQKLLEEQAQNEDEDEDKDEDEDEIIKGENCHSIIPKRYRKREN